MYKIFYFFLPFVFSLFFLPGQAQLEIDTSYSPEYIIRKVLLNKSSSITIENINYWGAKQSIGLFKFSTVYNKIIPRGIILSTGNVMDAKGPNTAAGLGSKVFTPGDIDLIRMATGPTYDATVLEFDFTSSTDTISFNYFFASEEYPEYVRKNVNDVFAFFLSSDELKFKKNLAVLEDGTSISVDNINSYTNKNLYIANSFWNRDDIQKWEKNKKKGELAYTLQYDGLTTLLHAGAKVIPGKKYHLKLAIADVGDRVFDSGIFIEAESFTNVPLVKDEKKSALSQLIDSNFENELKEKSDSTISVNINIHFDIDSFNIKDKESFGKLDKILSILNSDSSINVSILGHADRTGKEEKNLPLSFNRARTVSNYLIEKGINPKRINYSGMGASKPISSSDLSLNRRVEFIFKINTNL